MNPQTYPVSAVTITSSDGFPLAAQVFDAGNRCSGVVLLAPATGVPAGFYQHFAGWLAANGLTTVTWDWRGVGGSAPESLRGFAATMMDWACLDQPAVIDWASERFRMPLIAIGHSFGGQAFGLADRADRFARLVLFASGSAYWRLWPAPGRYLFRAAIGSWLLAARLFDYFPGRRLGVGADLPKGVAQQWLRWCLQPDYHGNWEGHGRMLAPVLSYGFSDDRFAPLASRQRLLDYYGGPKELITVRPAAWAGSVTWIFSGDVTNAPCGHTS